VLPPRLGLLVRYNPNFSNTRLTALLMIGAIHDTHPAPGQSSPPLFYYRLKLETWIVSGSARRRRAGITLGFAVLAACATRHLPYIARVQAARYAFVRGAFDDGAAVWKDG
jgi:hypothetical protein